MTRITRRSPVLLATALLLAPSARADPATAPTPPAPTAKVEAGGVVGRRVIGPDGREMGRLVDVLVDQSSRPRAAVIDFGGFLGVGSRRIAVDWSDLAFPAVGKPGDIQLDLPGEKIKDAPAYTDQTSPAAVVEPSGEPPGEPSGTPAQAPPPPGH